MDESAAGIRLDHFLCDRLTQFSRSRIQSWIEEDRARVNGVAKKASYKLRVGEAIEVDPAELKPLHAFAEEIPLDILYEDADIIAINKPPGLVVHAGAGCHSGTLVNASSTTLASSPRLVAICARALSTASIRAPAESCSSPVPIRPTAISPPSSPAAR